MKPPEFYRKYCEEHGLQVGTTPENRAAFRFHRAGIAFRAQYRVGRYRLDFAFPELGLGIEIDGPHHLRPDVAHRDAIRDAELRNRGWLIVRINDDENQLMRVVSLVNALAHR